MKVTDPDGTHVPPWIPPNTVVTAIDRKNGTITLSNTPITAGNAPLSFTLPNAISGKTNTGSNVISNIFDTSNLKPGMTVTGQGIPPNTTILKVDSSNKITLSSSSLQTIDGVMLSYGYDGSVAGSVTGNATNGSVYLNEIQVPAGGLLVKGMPITGLGIQDGTTIDSYNPATGPLIGTLTSGTTLIQAIDTSNLAPGMPISGTGIPFGAYVSEIVNPGVAGDIRFETAYGSTANFTGAVNDLQFNSSITMSKPAINDSSFGLMGDSQNLSNQLINIADTGNVLVGMTVTGGGFPVGTVVTAKTANSITLNNMAGASASVNTTVMFSDSPFTLPLSGDVTPAIPATNPGTIANIFDTTNMKSGMTISGIGIPPGTTITNITGPHSVQLLNPIATPVAGSALVISLSGDTAIGSKTISNIYDTSSLNIGMPISGKGIPADTYIESITDSHTIVLSHNATANATQTLLDRPLAGNTQVGSKVVDGLFSTSGLLVGMPVAGTNIPDGSVITDINSPTSISISNAATGTGKQLGVTFAVDRDYTSYYGTDDDINVNIDNGVSFTMNLHGGQLLRGEASPSGTSIPGKMDIIKVLDDLITAISTNDSAAILKGVNDLKLSNDQINDAVAEVAGKTLRLDSAEKMHNRTENTLKGLISQRQGLDLTKAGVEMTKETTAYEAALSSTAKIAQISILDYIR
jgi:flagellar hook-associated protein 3 FlgL